uniref:EF-hand domain-containing protein n=1 Tax=Cucumis melo TaxID=3656 RepID=A0A9I9CNL2_CUCME
MGQALRRFRGQDWKNKQLEMISNKIFDRFHKEKLSFEDLYIATLLVFNDINKYLPGPHIDPPTKERVAELVEIADMTIPSPLSRYSFSNHHCCCYCSRSDTKSDKNENQAIDRDEFLKFIKLLTFESIASVSQRLIITLVVAPTLAVVTKRSTEGIPGLGKMVQKVPSSAYALLVTLAALLFQNSNQQLLK